MHYIQLAEYFLGTHLATLIAADVMLAINFFMIGMSFGQRRAYKKQQREKELNDLLS